QRPRLVYVNCASPAAGSELSPPSAESSSHHISEAFVSHVHPRYNYRRPVSGDAFEEGQACHPRLLPSHRTRCRVLCCSRRVQNNSRCRHNCSRELLLPEEGRSLITSWICRQPDIPCITFISTHCTPTMDSSIVVLRLLAPKPTGKLDLVNQIRKLTYQPNTSRLAPHPVSKVKVWWLGFVLTPNKRGVPFSQISASRSVLLKIGMRRGIAETWAVADENVVDKEPRIVPDLSRTHIDDSLLHSFRSGQNS
ncbi:hypothetical protein QBC47DRAFT_80261, partial [Echria macrotheca]